MVGGVEQPRHMRRRDAKPPRELALRNATLGKREIEGGLGGDQAARRDKVLSVPPARG